MHRYWFALPWLLVLAFFAGIVISDAADVLIHKKVSALPDGPDTTLIQPSDWNDEHTFAGGANNQVLVWDGTESDKVRWVNVPPYAVAKAGDTMTGMLTLPNSSPTVDNHATRKAYVDAEIATVTAAVAGKVTKTGDTMSGSLTLPTAVYTTSLNRSGTAQSAGDIRAISPFIIKGPSLALELINAGAVGHTGIYDLSANMLIDRPAALVVVIGSAQAQTCLFILRGIVNQVDELGGNATCGTAPGAGPTSTNVYYDGAGKYKLKNNMLQTSIYSIFVLAQE